MSDQKMILVNKTVYNDLQVRVQELESELVEAKRQVSQTRAWGARWHLKAAVIDEKLTASQQQVKGLREALPDPSKLRMLAGLFDTALPNDPNPEVQEDLRAWATNIDTALSASILVGEEPVHWAAIHDKDCLCTACLDAHQPETQTVCPCTCHLKQNWYRYVPVHHEVCGYPNCTYYGTLTPEETDNG